MTPASGQRWTARLLAAMLSLALVFASLLGAAAHARDTHHSQHRHQSQLGQHHHHAIAAAQATSACAGSGVIAVAPCRGLHSANVATDVPEPDGSDGRHACVDFICHGGIAIVAAGTGWQVVSWLAARILPWDAQVLASLSPDRLDRPPKHLVSA